MIAPAFTYNPHLYNAMGSRAREAGRRQMHGMGSWEDWTKGLSAVLSSGLSLATPYVSQQTGWDFNANNSPTFSTWVVPIGNAVGNIFGVGPAGDYLSGTGQAMVGKVPLPVAWTGGIQLPANILDLLQAEKPAAPGPAPAPTPAPVPGTAGWRTWPTYYK